MAKKNQRNTEAAPTSAAGFNSPASLPEPLAQVALVDAKTAAAAGMAKLSWWYQAVAEGVAPRPAFKSHRFTRWRVADVAEFWRTYGADKKAA